MDGVKEGRENSKGFSDNRKTFSEKDLMPVIEEILQSGGRCELTVTGYSMVPTLKHKRDSVILISLGNRKIKKGDIVLIRRIDGKHILHRVYRVLNGGHLIINGDSQMWAEVVALEQVIGVVEKLIRNGREISCNNLIYKLYSRVWMSLRPFRGRIFRIRGRMKGEGDYEGRRK